MAEQTNTLATKMAVRHYFAQIWETRWYSIPAIILPGVGVIFTTYVPPLIVARVLSRFGDARPTLHDVLPYLLFFALAWFGGELIWRVAFFLLNRGDAKAIGNLYVIAMQELAKKDIGFFHDNFSGSLTKKVIGYGKNYEGFTDTLAFSILANLIPLLFAVVILWRFSPILVAALLGMMVLIGCIIVLLTRRRRRLVNQREVASNKMAGYVADIIGNMDAVQAFAHTKHETKQHERNARDYMHKAQLAWDYHNTHIDMSISPLYVLANTLGLALAIMFGKDAASLAAIFVTFNYFSFATHVLWEFNRIYRNIENAISEAAQFTELLLVPSALQEIPNAKKLVVKKGEVEFRDVTFAYDSRKDDPLFQQLNLRLQPGEKLALVGHSGGGKTTVTKLLLRFVDVSGGVVLIDGQNIAEARLSDVRDAIAFVPQEPIMFHRSIADNIRYGKLNATDEEIRAAARKANAQEFIEKLPKGYETMVGERGVKLSGGQRQRIAIARAIIKDAPILVLDEATSALDSESEKLIQDALWKLMKGRTAIVIAHRLSTIQKMDRIVVLDEGTIAEQGSHKQLIEQKGTYAKLWAHQSGGFLED
jgi:ATP-binding cassette subfamily B protein